MQMCDDGPITISIAHPDDIFSKEKDKIEPSFKYLQVLKIILFDIEHDEEDAVDLLRKHYANNQTILRIVNRFDQDYEEHSPIWWYTRDYFLSSIINQALQTMNMKILIKMSLFLHDICQQIEKIHMQKTNSLDSLTVYRCIKLNINDFKKLQDNKDVFMSFNSFLLTSINQESATETCSIAQQTSEILSVLFEIKIESMSSKFTPFVWLDELSYNSEKGILFSMNSVFRIIKIEKNQNNIWQVQLNGIDDHDTSLSAFISLIHIQTSKESGWDKLGQLMVSMGELKYAEDLYKVLLESTDINDRKAIILLYDNLGTIKLMNGSYEEADFFLEKKLQIQQRFLSSNDIDLVATYSTLGVLNSKIGRLEKALSFHEKALEIQKNILPYNDPNLGIIYDNIGLVNDKMGNHLTAISFHEKALQINEEILSPNHPDLAITYNNIGDIYKFMGNYLKALEFLEKAVKINEIILSSDDPGLAVTYDNIGGVYQHLSQYDNALIYYEKALKINKKVLHSNHPELAVTYSNIGNIKFQMKDYTNALLFYQKAIEIQQISLSPNHPSTAQEYLNIGDVYQNMEQYSKALSFYEKALQIQKNSLPHDHSDFVLTYTCFGELYYRIGKYATALSYFERGLEIGEVSLPEYHPRMSSLRQRIDLAEKELYHKQSNYMSNVYC